LGAVSELSCRLDCLRHRVGARSAVADLCTNGARATRQVAVKRTLGEASQFERRVGQRKTAAPQNTGQLFSELAIRIYGWQLGDDLRLALVEPLDKNDRLVAARLLPDQKNVKLPVLRGDAGAESRIKSLLC
jgi:hypothetical protein